MEVEKTDTNKSKVTAIESLLKVNVNVKLADNAYLSPHKYIFKILLL